MKKNIALTLVAISAFALSQPLQAQELQTYGTDLEGFIAELGGDGDYENTANGNTNNDYSNPVPSRDIKKICKGRVNKITFKCDTKTLEMACKHYSFNGQSALCVKCYKDKQSDGSKHYECPPKKTATPQTPT